jgi:hypothetical protein
MSRDDPRGPASIEEIRRLCHGLLPWHRTLTLLSGTGAGDYPEARRTHAAHLPEGEPLILVQDGTLFGGADLGLILTAERLCWKRRGGRALALRWDELDPALVTEAEDAVCIGEATIKLPDLLVPGMATLLREIARLRRDGEAGPYRRRVEREADDGATITTEALVARAWSELGPRASVRYHPLIPAAWLDRVRSQHAAHFQGEAPLAVVFLPQNSETISLALSVDRLYWTLSFGKALFHGWKNLEPHTIRITEYGALTVMGNPVALPEDCAVERMADLFRALVRSAGGVDLDTGEGAR